MRERDVMGIGRMTLVVAVGVGVAACDKADPRIQAAILNAYQYDPTLASRLCDYPVRSFSNVTVSQIRYDRGNQAGSGTAVVSGTPVAYAGLGAAQNCGGTISFRYQLPASRARGMHPSSYYNSRTEQVTVFDYNVLRRDAQRQ